MLLNMALFSAESQKQLLGAMPNKGRTQLQLRNSRCSEQCLLYGHSDSCWMPSNSKQGK